MKTISKQTKLPKLKVKSKVVNKGKKNDKDKIGGYTWVG